jgi:hypothetical protein
MSRRTRAFTFAAPLVLAACAFAGCKSQTENLPTRPRFAQTLSNQVDVLFMVDNSLGMQALQSMLASNFGAFTQPLRGRATGLPDLHIGVISSDMGVGDTTTVQSCRPGGDGGEMQTLPRGTCLGPGPSDGYMIATADEADDNFSGTLEEMFSCIATLGSQGCGFEHQLASVQAALGPGAPAKNAGFLRPDALLAIVLVTDEDDCSGTPEGDALLAPSMDSYTCNVLGHECLMDGHYAPPPSDRALADIQGCRSSENSRMLKIGDLVPFVKALKADRLADIVLAAITGPPQPYTVELAPQAQVAPSCTSGTGVVAVPAVRIKQLVNGLGASGLFYSACDPLATSLQAIGARIAAWTDGCLMPPSPGAVGDCHVTETAAGVETTIPSCAGGAGPPCWRFDNPDPACTRIAVTRNDVPPAGSALHADCGNPFVD